MLPGRERLREIAMSPGGSLEEVPYAVLLAALALEKRDVGVILHRRQTDKQITFCEGSPVDCVSNLVHETFGRFLVGLKKITEEEFSLAFAQANIHHQRLGEVLVERGLLSQEDASRLLHQNLARRLLDGFTWHDGTFELFDDPPEPLSPTKIHVGQLILTGVARFAGQAQVDSAVGSLVGQRLALNPDPPFPLEEFRLTEAQSRVAAALENRPRIDELAVDAGLPFEEITRILYAFWLLGAVVTSERGPSHAGPPVRTRTPSVAVAPPAVSRPAPSESPAPATAPPRNDRNVDELRRSWQAHRSWDAFELLGIPDDASDADVRGRYLERARAWAPWSFSGEDVDKAASLFLAAARAYARVADADGRDALRKSRREAAAPSFSFSPATRSVRRAFTIRTDLLDPEAQHRKGMDLFAAGDLARALSLLEFAADCDPQNGTYAADVAWCRYLAGGRVLASAPLAELDEAIRIDPSCGIANFYAGEIVRARGEFERAEGYYRKAARLMAPDRRPLDALREMTTKRRGAPH